MLCRSYARLAGLTIALALTLVRPPAALALAAAKSSDLVTLESSGTTDPACPLGGTPFATRILPDGTREPFTIPAKRVLVITSVDYVFETPIPDGGPAFFRVSLQTTEIVPVLSDTTVANTGSAAGRAEAAAGVAVRAGPPLCADAGITRSALLHGFLAKDK
ncbi:MAG TPA: hypothetical protein VNE71_08820 [Myxococcota bacterium]|nr:hypothetical protein [Myxococcota bacterium]